MPRRKKTETTETTEPQKPLTPALKVPKGFTVIFDSMDKQGDGRKVVTEKAAELYLQTQPLYFNAAGAISGRYTMLKDAHRFFENVNEKGEILPAKDSQEAEKA